MSLEIPFWSRVDKSGECWLWTGWVNRGGYGSCSRGTAHRVAWELANGPIPDRLMVLHHCDIRRCVRPDHLFLGTAGDNYWDARSKDRASTGDRNGSRTHPERLPHGADHWSRRRGGKITLAMAETIRRRVFAGEVQRALAREYGIHETTLSNVITGKSWRA